MNDAVPNAILRAAEARAQGLSWSAAAEQAGWQLPGLRAWIRRNRKSWHRVLGQARSEIHDAACDEAVTMLRRQLRASEPETAIAAATALTARLGKPKPKPKPADQNRDEEQERNEWLNSLSQQNLAALCASMYVPGSSDDVLEDLMKGDAAG
jgi:hypothetical protein